MQRILLKAESFLCPAARFWMALFLGSVCLWPAPAARAEYIYGIDDSNTIWEIDPVNRTDKIVVTGSSYGLTQSQKSNSFAYDPIRDEMFFTYSGAGAGMAGLYYWNHTNTNNAIQQILNSTTVVSGTTAWSLMSPTDPANAAYYQDSYWFFNGNGGKTNQLNRLSFTYTSGSIAPSALQTWTISNLPTANTFGDISISGSTGILYADTVSGKFYSIDLLSLSGTSGTATTAVDVTGVVGGNPSLQNAFSEDYSTLYATQFNNRTWYTQDTATGVVTPILSGTANWTTTVGFRDLGGSSLTAIVPEPSTLAMVIAGGALYGGLALRRKLGRK